MQAGCDWGDEAQGHGGKVDSVEADYKTLRDMIVQMKTVEQSQYADYVELSDKYAQSASRVAPLTAENERRRSERDTAHAVEAKADTEVERLWALVNARIAESQSQSESQSESPRSLRTQNIILSPSKAGEK